MTTLSPVHQVFTQLKNSSRAMKETSLVPRSSFTKSLLLLLKSENMILSFEPDEERGRPVFRVKLGASAEAEVISRPGLRVYRGWRQLRGFKSRDRLIISTSAGLMTAEEGMKRRLGGELIARLQA